MWIKGNNRLYCVTDESRVDYKTRISKALLDNLFKLAEEYNTLPNYLIETGLEKVISDGYVMFDKKTKPKDRIYYKSSYDKEILNQVKRLAEQNKLKYSDIIEYSFQYINPNKTKPKNYRNRIE